MEEMGLVRSHVFWDTRTSKHHAKPSESFAASICKLCEGGWVWKGSKSRIAPFRGSVGSDAQSPRRKLLQTTMVVPIH